MCPLLAVAAHENAGNGMALLLRVPFLFSFNSTTHKFFIFVDYYFDNHARATRRGRTLQPIFARATVAFV